MLAVLLLMREGSTRLPGKLLCKVGLKTLAEVAITKSLKAGQDTNTPVFAFLSEGDQQLCSIANHFHCPIIFRSDESVKASSADKLFDDQLVESLKEKGIDRILSPNTCMPFLTIPTIKEFIGKAKEAKRQFITVQKHQGWVFDNLGRKIWDQGNKWGCTNEGDSYQIVCPAFLYYPRRVFGTSTMLDFDLVPVPHTPEFAFDVDTADDLKMARVWEKSQRFYSGIGIAELG